MSLPFHCPDASVLPFVPLRGSSSCPRALRRDRRKRARAGSFWLVNFWQGLGRPPFFLASLGVLPAIVGAGVGEPGHSRTHLDGVVGGGNAWATSLHGSAIDPVAGLGISVEPANFSASASLGFVPKYFRRWCFTRQCRGSGTNGGRERAQPNADPNAHAYGFLMARIKLANAGAG